MYLYTVSETCLNWTLSKPKTRLNRTLSKLKICLNRTLSKLKTCLNRTLSKPKTCLHQTHFTVLYTKSLCNLNLCKPNTCLNWTICSVPNEFSLDRFDCIMILLKFYNPLNKTMFSPFITVDKLLSIISEDKISISW